jgi:cytochrome P450
MSTVFYYLLKYPELMQRVKAEVCSSFKSYDDIDALSTINLPYMIATIREALRIYPPLPLGLPRVVPEGGETIDGHFVPAGVRLAFPNNTTRLMSTG